MITIIEIKMIAHNAANTTLPTLMSLDIFGGLFCILLYLFTSRACDFIEPAQCATHRALLAKLAIHQERHRAGGVGGRL